MSAGGARPPLLCRRSSLVKIPFMAVPTAGYPVENMVVALSVAPRHAPVWEYGRSHLFNVSPHDTSLRLSFLDPT